MGLLLTAVIQADSTPPLDSVRVDTVLVVESDTWSTLGKIQTLLAITLILTKLIDLW